MDIVREVKERAEGAEQEVNKVDVPMTRRLGLFDFLKQVFKEMGEDHMGAFAGNLTYSAIFAIFPFLVFVVSLLGLFHATGLVNTMIDRAATTMPHDAVTTLRSISAGVTKTHQTGAFTIGAIIAMVGALWGVSGGFRAVMEAMNVMYEVKETRPFWQVYLMSIVLALVVAALMIGALVLVVAGPALGGAVAGYLGMGTVFQVVWSIVQWPVLLVFVLLAFAIIYYFAPNVKQRFAFLSPGAISALVLWLAFSLVFSWYVNAFATYNKTYGTLAGVAIFLLYLYYSAFIVLLGAEINHIIQRHAPGSTDGTKRSHGDSNESASGSGNRTLQILAENRPASEVKL
jgi:membrane protein